MAQLKKALEWKKIIITMTNDFYKNYITNIGTVYSVPYDVVKFHEKNPILKDVKHIEKFTAILDKVKNEWKTFGSPNEITPIYFQLVFINACNVINSLKQNLAKEEIKGEKIETSAGIDVVASTGMQILATVGNELVDIFKKYDLNQDQNHVFDHGNQNLVMILNQNAQDAFAKLIDNLMLFVSSYKQIQQLMANVNLEPGTQDPFEGPRTQLFIAWSNAYILVAMMLVVLLTYPAENGLMPEAAFKQMVPSINLF